MKENILQLIGLYEKGTIGRIKAFFHKYSAILEELFSSPDIGAQQTLFLDEEGALYRFGHEISGIEKITALLAIGKQKRTTNKTMSHEKKLNLYQVIRKDVNTVAVYNERFQERGIKPISPTHHGWNHLIALENALKEIKKVTFEDRELKIVLAGIIMLYFHLQSIPVWLIFDKFPSTEWDDAILEIMNDFNPDEFVGRAIESGYGELVQEIMENCIFSTTQDVIDYISGEASRYVSPPKNHESYNQSIKLIGDIKQQSVFTGLFIKGLEI